MKINDPRYNMREIVKELCLLEQHLLTKEKYCPDCISKHLLTVEGLAQEGSCLDTSGRMCADFNKIETCARRWAKMFVSGVPTLTIGQEVRKLRKLIAQGALDPEPDQVQDESSYGEVALTESGSTGLMWLVGTAFVVGALIHLSNSSNSTLVKSGYM